MHRNTGSFANRVETRDNRVRIIRRRIDHFAMIVTGYAAHIIMNRRYHRQRFAGQVDIGENLAGFGNTRQTFGQHFRCDMVKVEIDMILLRTDTAAFADFGSHAARDNVAAGQILGARRIAFHETLAFAVGQITALAACAFGNQHARAINAGRVKLDKFHILQWQTRAQHHAAAVTGAGMGRGRAEIAAAGTAGGQHHSMAAETVDRTVFEAQGDYAPAFRSIGALFHDQVDGEIFDEEIRVIFQALLIQGVQHRMAGTVGSSTGALDRRSLAHILHMAAERTLVDGAILVARERHAGMFQLVDRLRRFAHQIFDRVLVAEPVGALDRVIHMPLPVIGRIVAERSGNAALRRNRVRTSREHLGDTGRFQAGFRCAHGGAQAGATGTDNNGVIGVIDNLVSRLGGSISHYAATPVKAIFATEKIPSAAPPMAKKLSRTIRPNFTP